ncbi:Uma2 family endonuclease [Chamaesiphon sp. OTE_20_metabat_361]|uniref:Uma2 family endonuclease n=1 Tax=Chamaesiphon sp. OTE_20_metabat_361 TaxID=2964689 RepID=UPI00286AE58D|nr:Uma2 family endonuclease [Chamaesiphon sp. OTE_20_metabat_361]
MVAVREHFPRFTPAEYLEWEEQQEFRHEYINGEVYAMTGGTVNHSEIAMNFGTILRNQLEDSGCRVLTSDARVSIQNSSDYVYPDLSVTCDPGDRGATKFISHPCIIIEVLSPSTEAYDRGNKFNLYRRAASLQEYILVSTTEIAIDIYRKNERGRWEINNYRAGEPLELASISLTFPIERVFKGIVFDPESAT